MIIFENNEEIDVRAIKTFGVNVKDNDEAIGYFGTGLKYAIAVILRAGCTITIWSGMTEYVFDTMPTEIRGKPFHIVRMNGEELGFSTELGKNWEMWMAYRELHCNCTDEGGKPRESNLSRPLPKEGATLVTVKGMAFENAFKDRHSIILDKKLLETGDRVTAHEGKSNGIFYKNIRVHELVMVESLMTYNLTGDVELTEDRTLKYRHHADYPIIELILKNNNKEFIREVLCAPRGFYEYEIDYRTGIHAPGKTFLEAAGELREELFDQEMNGSAISLHKEHVMKSVLPTDSVKLNDVQETQLTKAKTFVNDILRCDMHAYPIIVLNTLGRNMLGRADDGKIYIALATFEQGTKWVAAALYEEYTHLFDGVKDETFEQKIIYLTKVLSLGEQINGEPL